MAAKDTARPPMLPRGLSRRAVPSPPMAAATDVAGTATERPGTGAVPRQERAAARGRARRTATVRRAGRWGALAAALALSAFTHLHRLGTTTALLDEVTYQRSGIDALQGTFTTSASPYLARLAFGVSQAALGEGLLAARLVSALASILTGVVLFVLGRRLAGWWTGVGALALWSALPQSTSAPDGSLTMVKLGRSALLEPLMALFVVLAIALCLRWMDRGRFGDAALTGAALGAAVASKPTAALVAPVVVVAILARAGPSWRLVAQFVALGVAALAVVAASYLPLGGEAPAAVAELVRYQTGEHVEEGHPVIVAGAVHDRAPWWAYAWWQWRSVGTAASVGLGVASLAALVWSPHRAGVAVLAASIVVPAAYLSFLGGFGLSHYLHLWQPMLVLLASLGLAALFGPHRNPAVRRGLGIVGGVLATLLVVASVRTTLAVATTERLGYGAVAELLADRDLAGSSVVVWGQTLVAEEYLPGAQIVLSAEEASRPVVAVIVDPGTARRDPRPELVRYLAEHDDELVTVPVDHLTVHLTSRSS